MRAAPPPRITEVQSLQTLAIPAPGALGRPAARRLPPIPTVR
jgi:hypothetical protein